jgi:protein involved in polysaccharide export with SLBB domain
LTAVFAISVVLSLSAQETTSAAGNAGARRTAVDENVPTYVLNPQDKVLIVVYAGEKQTGEYEKYVQSDGTVYLPYLEQDVKIGGLMLLDAQKMIEELSRKFIKEPRVVITMLSSFSQSVSTYGVIANRTVEIGTPIRVLQLLARVGGPLPGAIEDSIRVISGDGKVRLFNYRRVNKNPMLAENFLLNPGDIVFVPGADDYSIMVFGEVRTNGAFRMKQGDRVLDAMLRAGSWLAEADIRKVKVLRAKFRGGFETKNVDMKKLFDNADSKQNIVLQQGDIIYVPVKPASFIQPINLIFGGIYTVLLAIATWQNLKN